METRGVGLRIEGKSTSLPMRRGIADMRGPNVSGYESQDLYVVVNGKVSRTQSEKTA